MAVDSEAARARPTASSTSASANAGYPLSASRPGSSVASPWARSTELNANGVSARPSGGEMALVDGHDPAPLRVDVHLGDRDQDRWSGLHGGRQEVQLGARQFGRGVGHEHERVGRRQEGEGRRGVRGVEATDPGRVDQRDAPLEERVRQPDLDDLDPVAAIVAVGLGDPAAGLLGWDRLDEQLPVLAPPDDRARLWRVADDRDRHRREVVVDRADVPTDQGVDERALALLELADDAHDGVGPGHPLGDLVEPLGEVVAAPPSGQLRGIGDDGGDRGGGVGRLRGVR